MHRARLRNTTARATKGEVQALCRRKGYELVAARRSFSTEWVVALYGQYQGRSVFVRESRAFHIAEAYGDMAVWLRVRPDRPAAP